MTQAELEREVSRATGGSRGTVLRRGLSIMPLRELPPVEEFSEAGPQLIDWDEQDAIRRRAA